MKTISIHSTEQEIKFIAGIGTFAEEMIATVNVKSLLKKYMAALHKREDWAEMDRDKVIAAAMKRLVKLTKDEVIG